MELGTFLFFFGKDKKEIQVVNVYHSFIFLVSLCDLEVFLTLVVIEIKLLEIFRVTACLLSKVN
jgi:hypothetical protein